MLKFTKVQHFRLKVYLSESIKQYERLEAWAKANDHRALAHAHSYSAIVGRDILKEIENEERSSQGNTGERSE